MRKCSQPNSNKMQHHFRHNINTIIVTRSLKKDLVEHNNIKYRRLGIYRIYLCK